MCIGLHVKYPLFLSDFNGTWIFWTGFRKILEIRFPKIRPGGGGWGPEIFSKRTDRRTVGHGEDDSLFWGNFSNTLKSGIRKALWTWTVEISWRPDIISNLLRGFTRLDFHAFCSRRNSVHFFYEVSCVFLDQTAIIFIRNLDMALCNGKSVHDWSKKWTKNFVGRNLYIKIVTELKLAYLRKCDVGFYFYVHTVYFYCLIFINCNTKCACARAHTHKQHTHITHTHVCILQNYISNSPKKF